MKNFKKIVEILTKQNKTIATMESCTGGGVVNAITNVEGAGEVIEYASVTYSNRYKIKMGVSEDVINKYSVYSMETAKEMSKNIASFANAHYGIGVTGKLNRVDIHNLTGEDNKVYISIYDRENDKFYNKELKADKENRTKNKEYIIETIIIELENILK